MTTTKRIYIFDTTLRDGQQSPGAGMSFEDNLTYARLASELGIDVLEAGFPAASTQDFKIVHTIAEQLEADQSTMTVAALCQLREAQIQQTMAALAPRLDSGYARLHTYLPVDPNLMAASLGELATHHATLIEHVYRYVKQAVDAGFTVEFSPEGYSRMGNHWDFTTDAIIAAVDAGATIINCPDTIGGAAIHEGENYFVTQMQRHADLVATQFPDKDIRWSAHCHNDLGMAVTNSMNAIFNGPACQIEGCINGVGERAGNAALEQCIMYLYLFGEQSEVSYTTGIQLNHLQKISDFIAERMLPRQPHHPVTGLNAARHSSGGHTNAILNNPQAYQPFDPALSGNDIRFIFGPLSGSNHAQMIVRERGWLCEDHEKVALCQFIKDIYSERRKGITDDELMHAYFIFRQPINPNTLAIQPNEQHLSITIDHPKEPEKPLTIPAKTDTVLAACHQWLSEFLPDWTYHEQHEKDGEHHCFTVVFSHCNSHTTRARVCDTNKDKAAVLAYIEAYNQAYIDSYYHYTKEGK